MSPLAALQTLVIDTQIVTNMKSRIIEQKRGDDSVTFIGAIYKIKKFLWVFSYEYIAYIGNKNPVISKGIGPYYLELDKKEAQIFFTKESCEEAVSRHVDYLKNRQVLKETTHEN